MNDVTTNDWLLPHLGRMPGDHPKYKWEISYLVAPPRKKPDYQQVANIAETNE